MEKVDNNIILDQEEFDALSKITHYNKMDYWFSIQQDKNGYDYCLDLESDTKTSWKNALKSINDGLLEEDFLLLNYEEQQALNNLFKEYELPTFKVEVEREL